MFAVGLRTDLFLIATDNATCYEVVANRYCDIRWLYRKHKRELREAQADRPGMLFAAFAAGMSCGVLLTIVVTGGVYLG
jgi:hypothetical protein